jgi:hypothetical protein
MQFLRRARILAFCLDALVCVLAADAAGLLASGVIWFWVPAARPAIPAVWWLCGAGAAAAFLLRDTAGGFSRRWLALRVEDADGRPPGRAGSIRRNLPLLVPGWNILEVWPVLKSGDAQRRADRKAGRRVIVTV